MRLDDSLHALAATQHGCVAAWQLRDLGATSTEVSRWRRSARWTLLSPRVGRLNGAPLTERQAAVAAVLDVGSYGALGFRAAAALWGIPGYRLGPLDVTVLRGRFRSGDGYLADRLRETTLLEPDDVTVLDGIRVVRPELCLYQLCDQEHPERAERALDAALSMRLVSGASIARWLRRREGRGRDGTVVLRTLAEARGVEFVPPASNLESRVRQLAREVGITTLRAQVDSGDEHGWIGRVDFSDEVCPLIVEVQSERYHRALTDAEADVRRLARLRGGGWVVLEVWDTEVWHDPAGVQRRLLAARWEALGRLARSA